MHTKYSHLSKDELIRHVESKFPQSPILLELLNRFEETAEAEIDNAVTLDDRISSLIEKADAKHTCPECEAALVQTTEWDGTQFYFDLVSA